MKRSLKVDFLIAGVQKGGTSSLDAYLRQHPQIRMADSKEVHFFDEEAHFATGAPDYEVYHRNFGVKDSALIYGEATPIYFYWSDSMRRIWEYNRNIKIIVLLRNPVERAWSHWRMETNRGADSVPFAFAIRHETERTRVALPLQHRVYSYLDRGFYSEQIRRVRRVFDPTALLFIKSEEFFSAPSSIVERVLQFLKIDPAPIDTTAIEIVACRAVKYRAKTERSWSMFFETTSSWLRPCSAGTVAIG